MNQQLTNRATKLRTMRVKFIVWFGIFWCNGVRAFQLSMVASRAPFTPTTGSTISRNQNSIGHRIQTSPPSKGVTSGLISNLAVMALKRRLYGQTHVSCDVEASSSDVLLRGQVGPVTVKGRGWQSRLRLTCRAIEATVDTCQLDMGRVLTNQKLVLTVPARGRAMVALNAADFGNFITHPRMKPPGPLLASDGSSKLEFLRDNASVDPYEGSVTFFGTYAGARWKFTLRRGLNGQKALITVAPEEVPGDSKLDYISIGGVLAETTSKFFNDMVFELDGTFLSFLDMMVTGKGKEPSVMLSLSILVRKFPSSGLEF